jgi:hypothetical protein
MEITYQLHASATLSPGKELPVATEYEAECGPIANMDVMEKKNKTKLIPITVFLNIFHWSGFCQFKIIRAFTDGTSLQPLTYALVFHMTPFLEVSGSVHKFLVFSCVLHFVNISPSFIILLKIIMFINS